MLAQSRLNFAQFNAETAHLHLMVVAAQVLKRAVFTPARSVTGLVQPRAGHKRVRDKTLSAQVGLVEVTLSDAVTADVQLAGNAYRQRLPVSVQHIDPRIGDRATNRHGGAVRLDVIHAIGGRPDGGFGRPINVPQAAHRRLQPRCQRHVQRFAAAERGQLGLTLPAAVEQHPPGHGCGLQGGDAQPLDFACQTYRVGAPAFCGDHHRRADDQRQKKLQRRDVERHGGHRQPTMLGGQPELLFERQQQVQQRALPDHHAFGFAGRAGGIDHIRQCFGGRRLGVQVMLGACLPIAGRVEV
ncbi:Uncharacterized protein ALO75_03488 [Pseudomonas syringae pv. coryli]|uniref:Uncharacterized protein n=1 Tax=Pseudomonas syringae pv. coryli TaxID=317659 RepID=A0A0P9MJQ4_9PSED|nr:Uncharacterized protein ALO75_03488 [Pseudomonas syringae pv. coryli]